MTLLVKLHCTGFRVGNFREEAKWEKANRNPRSPDRRAFLMWVGVGIIGTCVRVCVRGGEREIERGELYTRIDIKCKFFPKRLS